MSFVTLEGFVKYDEGQGETITLADELKMEGFGVLEWGKRG